MYSAGDIGLKPPDLTVFMQESPYSYLGIRIVVSWYGSESFVLLQSSSCSRGRLGLCLMRERPGAWTSVIFLAAVLAVLVGMLSLISTAASEDLKRSMGFEEHSSDDDDCDNEHGRRRGSSS